MEKSDEIISNKLGEWRRKKRLSQKDLANAVGYSQSWISSAQHSKDFGEIEGLVNAVLTKFPETKEEDLVERTKYFPKASADFLELQVAMLHSELDREKENARSLVILTEQQRFRLNLIQTEVRNFRKEVDIDKLTIAKKIQLYEAVLDRILACIGN